jgi:hypothetical protein
VKSSSLEAKDYKVYYAQLFDAKEDHMLYRKLNNKDKEMIEEISNRKN